MGLFIRKPFEALQAEANASGKKTLKRVLGPWSLVALGVGVIIGAGLFSITGTVAAGYTGPAITLSFAIAALGCCFAGLCYAEFASMIPVAGSAYTYSYATMGELIAWIIGWDLVLEYTVAATTVSISWSRYLVVFLEGLDIHLPQALTACPWDGGVVNIPAFLIVVLMSLFLIRGTEGSSIFNGFIVFLKVSVILIFVILGWKYINTDNYTPYIPAKTPQGMACGSMGPTTAGRMDPYVDLFQSHGGSMIMLAKGNRSQQVTDACQKYGGFYLGSIGGPAAILAQNNIKSIECVEYPELGMEAIWKIEVENFPAFILVDDKGNDFFKQLKPWNCSK